VALKLGSEIAGSRNKSGHDFGGKTMGWIIDPGIWIGFVTLTLLEIVLGIDNIVFISILVGKLPQEQQATARTIGLALAMISRILLLLVIGWIVRLTTPLFDILGQEISGRDLILIAGGLFLVAKSTREIHHKLEGEDRTEVRGVASFRSVITQILMLDVVFSLDSVITAVGMVNEIGVMIAAVVVAVGVMLLSAGSIGRFVERHPTVKMLALSFLLLIGVTLITEGFHRHIPKGYIYFAMGFSVFVEMLNLRLQRTRVPAVRLNERLSPEARSNEA
jgi:predicted tellurium resistance membrane protein TerC